MVFEKADSSVQQNLSKEQEMKVQEVRDLQMIIQTLRQELASTRGQINMVNSTNYETIRDLENKIKEMEQDMIILNDDREQMEN